jgi:hypothetical protein
VSLRGAATWLHAIPAALAVFSGELLRAVDRKLGASLQAFTGVMGRAISASSIGGSVSFTAVLSRAAARLLALSGSLAEFGGDVARQTARRMAASLAGLTALTSRTVAVSVWFIAFDGAGHQCGQKRVQSAMLVETWLGSKGRLRYGALVPVS